MLVAGVLSMMALVSAAPVAHNATSGFSSDPLTGTIVGARFRCEGLWCPQWALDVTRYDPIRYPNTPYTYDLIELLPLAPTSERSGYLRTAYDVPSRIFTVAAADYPETGVDAVWSVKISPDITTASTVTSNVLFAHPDATTNNPGSVHLKKIMAGPDGRTVAVFNCGSIFDMDVAAGKYTKIGYLFGEDDNVGWTVSDAHVIAGTSLKSFVSNKDGDTFVIVTDLSDGNAVSGPKVKVQRPQGMLGAEAPLEAHMFTKMGESEARLMLVQIGNFDYISLVDESTGEIELVVNNLADSTSQVDLLCNESTKDCDMWQTSCVDPVSSSFFFQAHNIVEDVPDTVISMMQYTTSKVDSNPYAVSWIATEPMQFGFYGYQWVDYQN